jgi:hypothetical protein
MARVTISPIFGLAGSIEAGHPTPDRDPQVAARNEPLGLQISRPAIYDRPLRPSILDVQWFVVITGPNREKAVEVAKAQGGRDALPSYLRTMNLDLIGFDDVQSATAVAGFINSDRTSDCKASVEHQAIGIITRTSYDLLERLVDEDKIEGPVPRRPK